MLRPSITSSAGVQDSAVLQRTNIEHRDYSNQEKVSYGYHRQCNRCRVRGSFSEHIFADLGFAPQAVSYLSEDRLVCMALVALEEVLEQCSTRRGNLKSRSLVFALPILQRAGGLRGGHSMSSGAIWQTQIK